MLDHYYSWDSKVFPFTALFWVLKIKMKSCDYNRVIWSDYNIFQYVVLVPLLQAA